MSVIDKFELIEVVNVSGTMTALGASSVTPEVIEDVADILPRFVDMGRLQRKASDVIARVTGAEAGCVTACAASGLVISTAACMTGVDQAKVEQLPDTHDMKDEVIIQKGHLVWYGASVGQLIRLAGARPVEIGDATRVGSYQLVGAIGERTAAAMYVVSHHTVQYGQIGLRRFCEVAHYHDVPVIVDAASESDMKSFFELGADLVSFSGHKFLAAPTSGIVAGRADLIRACYMHQHAGIGRPMKVGKEGVVGAISALTQWEQLDHQAIRERQDRMLGLFLAGLRELPGLTVSVDPDPTGNPIDRAKVIVNEQESGLSAYQISRELAKASPPVIVRAHHSLDEHVFFLDPCNVDEAAAQHVVDAIRFLVDMSSGSKAAVREVYNSSENSADTEEQVNRSWLSEVS